MKLEAKVQQVGRRALAVCGAIALSSMLLGGCGGPETKAADPAETSRQDALTKQGMEHPVVTQSADDKQKALMQPGNK